jgi:eukaryotic-like serine/threonine-protein kinase
MIGKTLGNFQITDQLGKGGMGEVYRAHDTKLNRDVALKILPAEFANDAERMGRFKREAQLLASLNHPNIAAIYGLEESGGVRALIMELAEGPTLAERILKGPIPLDEALGIAQQIAEALEAAHEKGIIHRDLKPANIKVTPDGKVKVLDFGLAKALEGESSVVDASESPTLSLAATQAGVILGTAAYMAPEQARGSGADKRCDIWSFGVVLYEMLTGKQLFAGQTVSDTIAAVLRADVDWNLLPANTPASIRTLLRRCLNKDRKQRLRDIGDARIAIEEYIANPSDASAQETAALSGGKLRERLAWGGAFILLAAALTVLSVIHYSQAPVEVPYMQLQVNTGPTSAPTSIAISPNGRLLAFVASEKGKQQLWLRRLDSVKAQPLPGTENATLPFWSPNSQSIGFFADAKLKKIDIASGQPQPLADAPAGCGGAWNRDGVIVFAPSYSSPLLRVPASGGVEPIAVTQLDSPRQWGHLYPQFLPDGRRLLFYAWGTDPGVCIGSLNSRDSKHLVSTESQAVYSQSGYLLFIRQGSLVAQRFDSERGVLLGDSVRIFDSVAFNTFYWNSGISISETGTLAYRQAGSDLRRLSWFDRNGKPIGQLRLPDDVSDLYDPELSPDDRQVLVNGRVRDNTDVFLIDTITGVFKRFTFDTALERWAVWSHDGRQVVFTSMRTHLGDLYKKSSNGAVSEEIFLESPLEKFPMDFSWDGKFFLYVEANPKTFLDIWVKPLIGVGKPFAFVETNFEEGDCQFSRDGRWVAYQSNESGIFEIWVKAFPDGGKQQITYGGGIEARWNRNGKEIFYIALDGKMMVLPIRTTGQTLDPGTPKVLFQTSIVDGGNPPVHPKTQYAVSSDGQRFLINTIADESAPPITIVTNWTRALKK